MRPPVFNQQACRSTVTSRVVRKILAPRLPVATRRCAVRVVGDLSARGRPILPKSITVERIMGEGSFGQVFGGYLNTPTGNQRVVLKRVKTRVQGAEEMSQMEHLLNVYASRVARGHCADFLGYCEVADAEATGRLTAGLWLVWKYEGSKTLSYYLRRRDTLRALATDLAVPESVVVPTVMRHIFEGLAAFHAAGLVHRDVKPLNMILAEDVRRFKLIDLGACADLRSGTNYVPEESILDLNFCPPEQFVMPTDSPHIAKQVGLFKMAISPMLWAKHKPDRFDTWSAGIVMLQLAIPATRTDRALRNFNSVYGPKYKYDLAAWRKGTHLSARDCALLDADDGAGWDLLQSLLAPRHIQVDDNGGVSFVNDTPFQRISAFEALKHRHIKGALEAAAASQVTTTTSSTSGSSSAAAAAAAVGASTRGSASSAPDAASAAPRRGRGSAAAGDAAASSSAAAAAGGGGAASTSSGGGGDPLGSALGLWRDMTGRLFDLEARIMRQASATEVQTTTVRRLKEQVDRGKVDPALLQKEEKVLNKMQTRLAGLQQDFSSTANQASGIFSFFGFGGKPAAAQGQQAQLDEDARSKRDKSQQNLQALRSAEAAAAAAVAANTNNTNTGSSSPSAVSSAAGMFNSVWERLSSRLAELERKISNQASATERQSLVVRGLRAKVKAGEVEEAALAKAERTLNRMERRLLDLDRDYWAAKQNARGALAGNMPSDGGSGSSSGQQRSGSRGPAEQSAVADALAAAQAARQGGSDIEASGSFWSRLLGVGSSSSMDGSSSREAALQPPPPPPPTSQEQQPPSQFPALPRGLSPLFGRATASPTNPPPQPQAPPPLPPPPQPQSQSQSQHRTIFGALAAGLAGASPSSSPSSSAAVNTQSAAVAPAAPRTTSPLVGGGGGFLGGIFGPNRQSSPQQQSQQPPPGAAVQGSNPGSSNRKTSSSSSSLGLAGGLPVPPPAAPTTASGGDALVEGASRVIRNSLNFTGLAARIAGDMATAFKADAERYLKELEIQEAAKRQQRTLDLAFLALLREVQPPVRSTCSYEETEERLGGEVRWAALADGARRRELFAKYLLTARKVEEQAAAAADAAFRAALRRYNVAATSRWEDLRDSLAETDPAVAGVQDAARRQQLFLEVVAELQLQAALQAASLKAEMEFANLLAELRDPPVTSTSTWALVRKVVAADPRCQALPERRRRELFESFTARLFEAEARRSELAVAAAEVEEAAEAVRTAELAAAGLVTEAVQVHAPAPAAAAAAVVHPTSVSALMTPSPAPPPAAVPPPQHQQPSVTVAAATAVVAVPSLPVAIPDAAATAAPVADPPPLPTQPAATPSLDPVRTAKSSSSSSSFELLPASPASSSSPPSSPSGAGDPTASQLDDDDLSAALEGMEAALESAIKAVSSAPLPLPSLFMTATAIGTGTGTGIGIAASDNSGRDIAPATAITTSGSSSSNGSGNANVVSVPPSAAFGSLAAPINGIARKPAVTATSSPPSSPGPSLGSVESVGSLPAAEGIRLDELRREQARLRVEYEAMAQRLREMEERLKSQAQLMTMTEDMTQVEVKEVEVGVLEVEDVGLRTPRSDGGSGDNGRYSIERDSDNNSDGTNPPLAQSRRGSQRWR